MIEPAALTPGDFIVTRIRNGWGDLIGFMEELNDFDKMGLDVYQHAATYVGDGKIVEAQPGKAGAVTSELSKYQDGRPLLYSTGRLDIDKATLQRVSAIAVSLVGTRYSFATYLALGAHRFDLPVPFLDHFVADSHRMICSTMVGYAYMKAGRPLFNKWTGDIVPKDLASILVYGNG